MKSNFKLSRVTGVSSYEEGNTYDIEVNEVHCFNAKNELNGFTSISHNSAVICLFSPDDEEMAKAKTADWFIKNPQRGRSNNSALLVRSEISKDDFAKLFKSTKDFGEPGFIWTDNDRSLFNPCVPGETEILTASGIKTVNELIGNQFIALVNGEEFKSTESGFFYTGNKDVYKITTECGKSVETTSNHKLLVLRNSKPEWIEQRHINVGDYLMVHDHSFYNSDAYSDYKKETENDPHYAEYSVFRTNKKAIVKSIEHVGKKDVYDCTINGAHAFDSSGLILHNCCEIGLYGYDENGNSGWEFCNLTTINVKKCKTEDDFYSACKASAIVGTIQASYNKFPYLGKVTEDINKREALLGCSMTGIMDNPAIALNPIYQQNGAKTIIETNEKVAKLLGINAAARVNAIKPEGTSSCLLGVSNGIHPSFSRRYLRRVQANVMESPLQYFEVHNPKAVEKSVWSKSGNDKVISFLCEVPDGAIVKNQVGAIELLEKVMLTQQNWIEYGTTSRSVQPWLRHNVSNTISVKTEEWDDVEKFIYDNKKWFGGISLLPFSGDLDYPQAPFSNILNEKELIAEYGEGSLFASGLIVDGLDAFSNNLWAACDCALDIGQPIVDLIKPEEPIRPAKNGFTDKQHASKLIKYAGDLKQYYDDLETFNKEEKKKDWVRRFKQFATRYVDSDLRKCSHLLKHVSLWKLWLDLKREYQEVDWSLFMEEDFKFDMNTLAAASCSAGGCELK
jgi:hypothetical protein